MWLSEEVQVSLSMCCNCITSMMKGMVGVHGHQFIPSVGVSNPQKYLEEMCRHLFWTQFWLDPEWCRLEKRRHIDEEDLKKINLLGVTATKMLTARGSTDSSEGKSPPSPPDPSHVPASTPLRCIYWNVRSISGKKNVKQLQNYIKKKQVAHLHHHHHHHQQLNQSLLIASCIIWIIFQIKLRFI